MKPLYGSEALQLEKSLQVLKDSFLQDILSSEKDLLAIFYKNKKIYYLWFDFTPSQPLCLVFHKKMK